jgi:hypothetical protein
MYRRSHHDEGSLGSDLFTPHSCERMELQARSGQTIEHSAAHLCMTYDMIHFLGILSQSKGEIIKAHMHVSHTSWAEYVT